MASKQPGLSPYMEPCLRGICFDSTEWEQLPATPVLSILKFRFKDEVELENPSKPVYALWRKSVEFVSKTPGFQGLYWGPIDKDEILVLVQWDSGKAWSRFECSLGFSMLLGHLEHVTNRCMQIALPTSLLNASFRVEVVSYDFPASPEAPQTALEERQSNFKERWNSIFQFGGITDAIDACGEWIEDDYLVQKHFFCYGLPKGLIAENFEIERYYFVGLVFWKTDRQFEFNASSTIADQFALLAREASTVTISMTEQMRYEGINPSISQNLSAGHSSGKRLFDKPLLNIPVTCQCDLDDLSRMDRADRVHLDSVELAYRDRLVPSPAGTWYSMGSINQYDMPKNVLHDSESQHMVLLVSFRLLHNTPCYKSAFGGLRDALWKLSGWRGVRQGTNPKDPERVYLIAGIGNIKATTVEVQQNFHEEIQVFKTACTEDIQDLLWQQVPGPEKLDWQIENLDIFTFDVSDCESDRQSLAYAFNNLQSTTKLQKNYGPPIMDSRLNAVTPYGMAYELEDDPNEQDQRASKFTFSWRWRSGSAGRDIWYDEFAKRAQKEYENLGHTIEWLRAICNSSENIFLVFDHADSEIGPVEMAHLASNNLPRPGSLFGGAAC
ncbi:hypothetical protein N7528_006676 [Penicillium herquei]|nr:hypothetical protein N7528_006676 [Penicillium herquei]